MMNPVHASFHGGVHPPGYKELSSEKRIETLPPPDFVVIPLQQHIGKPSEALVQKGDSVSAGQPVSRPDGFVSLPSHASISGTVRGIELYPHPLGQKVPAVIIDNDGENRICDEILQEPDSIDLPAGELKKRIGSAGVAGMGGATFPTHVKLSPPEGKTIDTVIINGAECEPYLTADYRLMVEHPEDVLNGLKIILRALNIGRGIIAIEKNKPEAIALFQRLTAGEPGIDVAPLNVKYPQGAEKQLIYVVSGRKVPAGKLPMEVGCLVQNVGTAKAVYDAVAYKKPLIGRVVTVTGGVKNPKNLYVPIGTPVSAVIEHCGGFSVTPGKIIMGGPMMGIAQYTLDVPVIKGSSGILVQAAEQCEKTAVNPCLNCGNCVEACPMGLMPNMLVKYIEHKKWEAAKAAGILNCMECGSCAYVCPSERNVVQSIRYGKYRVMELGKAEKN